MLRHLVLSFLLFVPCVLVLCGCGNPSVKGTVKFDDGSSLTTGTVMFVSGSTQATGTIQSDGSYSLSEQRADDGVTPGTYKVAVHATTGGDSDGEPEVQLVDPKFADPNTSGLTCEVKGTTTFDITVTKPEGKK